METLRKGPMPDLRTVIRCIIERNQDNGANGCKVIPTLQAIARYHNGGWVLDQTTLPGELAGALGSPLAEEVRVGNAACIDRAGNIFVKKPTPDSENA